MHHKLRQISNNNQNVESKIFWSFRADCVFTKPEAPAVVAVVPVAAAAAVASVVVRSNVYNSF